MNEQPLDKESENEGSRENLNELQYFIEDLQAFKTSRVLDYLTFGEVEKKIKPYREKLKLYENLFRRGKVFSKKSLGTSAISGHGVKSKLEMAQKELRGIENEAHERFIFYLKRFKKYQIKLQDAFDTQKYLIIRKFPLGSMSLITKIRQKHEAGFIQPEELFQEEINQEKKEIQSKINDSQALIECHEIKISLAEKIVDEYHELCKALDYSKEARKNINKFRFLMKKCKVTIKENNLELINLFQDAFEFDLEAASLVEEESQLIKHLISIKGLAMPSIMIEIKYCLARLKTETTEEILQAYQELLKGFSQNSQYDKIFFQYKLYINKLLEHKKEIEAEVFTKININFRAILNPARRLEQIIEFYQKKKNVNYKQAIENHENRLDCIEQSSQKYYLLFELFPDHDFFKQEFKEFQDVTLRIRETIQKYKKAHRLNGEDIVLVENSSPEVNAPLPPIRDFLIEEKKPTSRRLMQWLKEKIIPPHQTPPHYENPPSYKECRVSGVNSNIYKPSNTLSRAEKRS